MQGIDSTKHDLTENPYYKELTKSLRQKQSGQQAQKTDTVAQHQADAMQDIQHDDIKKKNEKLKQEKQLKENRIKDQVSLSSADTELIDDSQDDKAKKKVKQREENLKFDAKQVLRYLGQKIDLASKVPEFKEMFMQTMIQSRSHNDFLSRFGQFKVGIVGQILSLIGINPDELKALKRKALKEAFDENVDLMAENLYNTELAELIYGKSKKNKNSLKLFNEVQQQLIQKMKRLGRLGYWSKTRLLEGKLAQTKRIYDEFVTEKNDLEYQYSYISYMGDS